MKRYMGWDIDFLRPAGGVGLRQPRLVQWRVYKNPVALALGGVCAVLLEFADPRIRSGVWDHWSFPRIPWAGASARPWRRKSESLAPGPPRIRSSTVLVAFTRAWLERSRAGALTGPPIGACELGLCHRELWFCDGLPPFSSLGSAPRRLIAFADAVTVGGFYGAPNPPSELGGFFTPLRRRRFEAHAINEEFLDIMRSGRAAPGVPRWLQGQMAAASISLLPAAVRAVLGLGPDYDLTPLGRFAVRRVARLADRIPQPRSPAAEASQRLGLPWRFPWLSLRRQGDLLALQERKGKAGASETAADLRP